MPMEENDIRYKTADEIEDIFHSAGRIARTAVLSDDITTKTALKLAIKAMVDQAVKRLDESVGASAADEED